MNSDKKRIMALVFLGLFFLSLTIALVSAQLSLSLEKAKEGITIFIGEKFGETATEVAVSIIILLIIFAGLYDILQLISIFQETWVKVVIAGGIAIITVLFDWIVKLNGFLAAAVGTLGAIGIFLEILVAILIFIGLVIGNTWAATFAAKRKSQVETIKAIKSAGEAKAAIKGLREIQKEFDSKA